MQKRTAFYVLIVCYLFSALQFVRFYVKSAAFYLDMNAYLDGRERLPFQERILPVLFLRPLYHSTWIMQHLVHTQGIFDARRGPFYLLSLLSFLVAAIYTQQLYRAVSTRGVFSFLVFPVFLYTVIWTYAIHTEANFAYPYDLSSLAFFTAGLNYIFRRRYLALFVVILIGTFNRETTLFLIGIYAIDAAFGATSGARTITPRLIPWTRLLLLSCVWLSVKMFLSHLYRSNDASESYVRISNNFHQLKPRLLPALLNICGYTLPIVLLFRRRSMSLRFRNYLWILPLWFAVMFCSGVIVETRIYGELCSYSAVAVVLMLESFLPAAQSIAELKELGRVSEQLTYEPV